MSLSALDFRGEGVFAGSKEATDWIYPSGLLWKPRLPEVYTTTGGLRLCLQLFGNTGGILNEKLNILYTLFG